MKLRSWDSSCRQNRGSNPRAASVDISILDLINGVKIYDYDMQRDDTYTPADIRYSFQEKNP